jgi:hypothetical protein
MYDLKLWNFYRKKKEKTLVCIGIGNYFLNKTPVPQQMRERIDKWECIKLKSFCTAKEIVRQTTEWEKIFVTYTADKKLITRIYRELKN